ncbi:hypothetical protein [Luteococcus peritonei]|uniref:Uncharacterized protein n=1 Tax=Luteococcus peritonei TaxID=88874 RepID=A0ABW4RVP9_9ACTN
MKKMLDAIVRNAANYMAALAPESMTRNPEAFTQRERMLGRGL